MRSPDQNSQPVTDPGILEYAEFSVLHSKWEPHEGQALVGRKLFYENIRSIFIQCGRKWGKTDLIEYMLWRWAKTRPGASCYYISPFLKQSREIVWANRRIQNFGPRDWLLPGSSGINNSELRLRFRNGSFIKCDGSDNFDSYRGVEPHFVVLEESKDHRPEFLEAMRPNLAVYNAPLVFIGTPPEEDDHTYWQDADEHKNDPNKFFYQATSWDNPHISGKWLEDERTRLYDRGVGDVWERDYEAKRVKGGSGKIFPMLQSTMQVDHQRILDEIYRDKRRLDWFLWADPAAASVFAVLFCALNPYTKTWYVLDEIYEKDQAEMTVQRIGQKIIDKRNELFVNRWKEWRQGYDEAETWFRNEMQDHFDEHFEPTQKMKTDKTTGVSLTKDIMLQNRIKISSRCKNFYWELDHYRKDGKTGKIPKKDDHLIDCWRYILAASAYDTVEQAEKKKEQDEMYRGSRIEDDFPGFLETGERVDDWSSHDY